MRYCNTFYQLLRYWIQSRWAELRVRIRLPIRVFLYDIGYKAGEMAYDILVNGADITTMKIESAPNVTKMYNPTICEELGITIPDGYEAIEE